MKAVDFVAESIGCPLTPAFHRFDGWLIYISPGLLQSSVILWLIYLEWNGMEVLSQLLGLFLDLHILHPLLLSADQEDDINALEKELFNP